MAEHMWKWIEVSLLQACSTKPTLLLIMLLGAHRDKIMCPHCPNQQKEKKICSTRCSWERNAVTMNVGRRGSSRAGDHPQVRCCMCECEAIFVPNHMPAHGGLGWPYMHVQCRPPLLHRAVSNSERLTSKQHGGSEPAKTHEEMWVLNQSPKLNGYRFVGFRNSILTCKDEGDRIDANQPWIIVKWESWY